MFLKRKNISYFYDQKNKIVWTRINRKISTKDMIGHYAKIVKDTNILEQSIEILDFKGFDLNGFEHHDEQSLTDKLKILFETNKLAIIYIMPGSSGAIPALKEIQARDHVFENKMRICTADNLGDIIK